MSFDTTKSDVEQSSTEIVPAEGNVTLRQIPDGENFSAKTEYVGNKTVNAVYAIRRHEKGPRYEKATLFDFGNVTEEQLYLLAMYGAKVKVQAILRALSPEAMLDPKTLSTVDVATDVIGAKITQGDPMTVAIRSLMKMGVSEAAARAAIAEAVASEPQS